MRGTGEEPAVEANVALQRRRRRGAGRRRGNTIGGLIIGAGVLMGLAALAIDTAILRLRAIELQNGCTAGALAGGALLFDESLLPPPLRPLAADRSTVESEVAAYAAMNRAGGKAVALDREAGDIEFDFIEDPTAFPVAFEPDPEGRGRVNAVRVRCARAQERGNPVTLALAGTIGLDSADLSAEAIASLDQRVWGFRPLPICFDEDGTPLAECAIPLAPILIEQVGNGSWEQQVNAPAGNSNDRFRIEPGAGEVTREADGTPEVVVSLTIGGGAGARGRAVASGNARLLHLNWQRGRAPHNRTVCRQIVGGLSSQDLASVGGVFKLELNDARRALKKDFPPPRWGRGGEASGLLRDVSEALSAIAGQPRIWPLGVEVGGVRRVTGFAAGAVADCDYNPRSKRLTFTLQPCLMQTKTALTGALPPGQGRNPYIGRLYLNR